MLLIDGVKYVEWTPPSEDEFERVVKEHTQDIFGEQSIYLDRKQKLKALSGIGSRPDGYAIVFGVSLHWHIVEVELSTHPLHDHIVAQVGRFISGIGNPNIQRGIVNAMDEKIARDDFLRLKLRKAIEPTEIYRFLADLISKQPILTIIIDKDTEELREALNTLRYPQIKVVEFQTFTREGAGFSVHAHVFEPLYRTPTEIRSGARIITTQPPQESGKRRKVLYQNFKLPGVTKTANTLLHEHLDELPKDIQDKVRYADDHRGSRTWARYVELAQSKGHLTDWTPVK